MEAWRGLPSAATASFAFWVVFVFHASPLMCITISSYSTPFALCQARFVFFSVFPFLAFAHRRRTAAAWRSL
jgi:hypothetical protein